MEILLVSNMYPSRDFPYYGAFVKNAKDNLENCGHNVQLAVLGKGKKKSFLFKTISYVRFYIDVFSKLRNGDFDFVYLNYLSHVAIPIIFFKIIGGDMVIVSHAHGGDLVCLDGASKVFFKMKRFLSRIIINYSKVVITPSLSYSKLIIKNYNVDCDKIKIYPSGGVDPCVFNICSDIEKRLKIIGYAGRLIKSKNVDKIIMAMIYLPDFKLEIVGDGPCYDSLLELINKYDLQQQVEIKRSKCQSDLAKWYNSIDILVYPSSSESLGLVPLEAICCGANVILSDLPVFSEFKRSGIFVKIIKSISASDIVYEILNYKPLSNKERQDNVSAVLKHYSKFKARNDLNEIFK